MVLERLINPKKNTGKYWEMFLIGVVYSLVGFILGYWVFKAYVSLIMVSFTAIAAVPFVHGAIENEEKKEKKDTQLTLLKEHGKLIGMFIFLFLGFILVFSVLSLVLPEGIAGQTFKAQAEAITAVRTSPTGNFISSLGFLETILFNNLKILFFCLVFSFFYGVGAIFILSWNASVMGLAIGSIIRGGLEKNAGNFFHVLTQGFLSYLVHGLPEIVSYFVAGLAGGIISVALVKEGFKSSLFMKAGKDSLNLIFFAVILLILSALIEVFISPNLS